MISRLRILVLAAIGAAGVVACVQPGESEAAQWVFIWTLEAVGLLLLVFASEADERRPRIERNRTPPLLLAPLVPGEGRGLSFVFLGLCAAFVLFLVARHFRVPHEPLLADDDPTQLGTICIFAWCYCTAAALAARRWPMGSVRLVRLGGLVLCAFLMFLLIGFLCASGQSAGTRRFFLPLIFPPRLLEFVKHDGRWNETGWMEFLVLCGIAAALTAANLRRIVQGLTDLARLRRTVRTTSG